MSFEDKAKEAGKNIKEGAEDLKARAEVKGEEIKNKAKDAAEDAKAKAQKTKDDMND